MATKVGMKLALDGEAQYKASLQQIQQKSKELASEMKAVVSAGEGEEKQMEVLSKQITNQKDLIDTLTTKYNKQKSEIENTKKAIEDAKKAYGDNNTEVQKLETQLTKQETALSKTKTQLNNEKTALNQMEKAEESAAKEADNLGDETKDAGKEAKSAGDGGFTVLKGVLANLATDAIKSALNGIKNLAGGIKDAIKETSEYGDEVDKASQKLGLSAEKYQELSYAMEMSGADISSFQKGMLNMNEALADFANGNEDAGKAYTNLGVSLRNSDGSVKTSEQLLLDTVDALASMEDTTQRDAAAQDIFGKKMTELRPLLNGGAESIKQLMQEAKDYGMVMSDEAVTASANFDDSMTRLDGTVQGLKRRMASEFLPGISDVADGLSKMVAGVDGGSEDLKKGIQNIITTLTDNAPGFLQAGKDIFVSILGGIQENLPDMITAIAGVMPDLFTAIADTIAEIDIAELVKAVFKSANAIITAIVPRLPELLTALISGVIEALPELFVGVGETIYNIFNQLFGGYTEFDAFKDKIDAQTEAWHGVTDAMGKATDQVNNDAVTWSNQWDILKEITDSSGNVKEGFEGMAEALVGELNDALGLNIEIIDGQIQDYQTLCKEIDNVIEKKRAEIILQAEEEAYAEALRMRPELLAAVSDAEANLTAAQEELTAAQREYDGLVESGGDLTMSTQRLDNARRAVGEMQTALDDATVNLEENTALQTRYMDDYTKVMAGDYNEIGRTSKKYTGSTAKDLTTYRKNVEKQLDQDKQNYDSWVKDYQKSNSAHAKAQADYYASRIKEDQTQIAKINGIIKQGGKDFTQGYVNGILEKESSVTNAGNKVTNDALKAVQNTQQSQSPSKVTKGYGNDFGEGYKLGIDEKGATVKTTAEGVAGKALTGIDSKKDAAKTAGTTVGTNFTEGIKSKESAAKSAGDSVALNAKNGLETQNANAKTAGTTVGGNFVTGVNDKAKNAKSAGDSLALRAKEGLESQHANASSAGSTIGGKFIGGIDTKRDDAYNSGDWLAYKARTGMETEGDNAYDNGEWMGDKFNGGIDTKRAASYDSGDWLAYKARLGMESDEESTKMTGAGSSAGGKFVSGMEAKEGAAQTEGDWLAYSARKGMQSEEEAEKIYQAGKDVSEGFAAGIGDAGYLVTDAAYATAVAARKKFEVTMDIASPSKVMRKLGRFIPAGAALGIEDGTPLVTDAMGDMAQGMMEGFTLGDVSYQHAAAAIGGRAASNTTNNNNTITMNIYGAEGQNVNELAEIISDRLSQMYDRKVAVYA